MKGDFTSVDSFVSKSLLKVLALLVFAALTALPSYAQLSESATKQIDELLAFKKTFSPAEQKTSSNLVVASRKARHIPLGNLERFINAGKPDAQGKLIIDIGADLSPALMSSRVMSSIVTTDVPQPDYGHGHVRAQVQPSQLLELAANSDVKFIRDADLGTPNVASVTSPGYVTHPATKPVPLGYDGTGVTVGVLSDTPGPARVAALITRGELPASVQVVPGQAGAADDGMAALLESVPGPCDHGSTLLSA